MKLRLPGDKLVILSYFIATILLGSLLLSLEASWSGPCPLPYIDALFTSTSAVCVTGLITVDTALYTRFGQAVILALIQAGGLGIITFATIYVALPRKRISLVNRSIIKDFYVDEVEYDPRSITRDILISTVGIEALGALVLHASFKGGEASWFNAVFHSVSAFCNAGFSTFSDNLEGYVGDPRLNITIAALIALGGIGFTVMRDVGETVSGRKRRLSTHSRIVLTTTAALIGLGWVLFYILERGAAYSGLSRAEAVLASMFQAVTPRTAGFDTVPQSSLSGLSVLIVIMLMFIGASPASTGGGIKTSTFFVLALASLRGVDEKGRLAVRRRSLPGTLIVKALGIAGKALLVALLAAGAILVLESRTGLAGRAGVLEVLFESVSALATAGLSLGITAGLSAASKLVLILTMFVGRVGLFAMAMPGERRRIERYVDLPETTVLVG